MLTLVDMQTKELTNLKVLENVSPLLAKICSQGKLSGMNGDFFSL